MFLQTLMRSALLLVIPTLIWAQEPANSISGTIGDRPVTVAIRPDQSDFHGDGRSGGVSIISMPVARDAGFGAISIGFEGADFLGGDLFNVEIGIGDTAAESQSQYYADLDSDLRITITQSEVRDGALMISGTIMGTLTWRQLMPIAARREDPARQLPIDLTFAAVIETEF